MRHNRIDIMIIGALLGATGALLAALLAAQSEREPEAVAMPDLGGLLDLLLAGRPTPLPRPAPPPKRQPQRKAPAPQPSPTPQTPPPTGDTHQTDRTVDPAEVLAAQSDAIRCANTGAELGNPGAPKSCQGPPVLIIGAPLPDPPDFDPAEEQRALLPRGRR